MTDICFIRKERCHHDVPKHFFEAAADAEINPLYASRMWHDALLGDVLARKLVERLCDIEIIDSDTGFRFLE